MATLWQNHVGPRASKNLPAKRRPWRIFSSVPEHKIGQLERKLAVEGLGSMIALASGRPTT
jgi:hypothetical protein